jgi:hypothetical protein
VRQESLVKEEDDVDASLKVGNLLDGTQRVQAPPGKGPPLPGASRCDGPSPGEEKGTRDTSHGNQSFDPRNVSMILRHKGLAI